MRQSLNIIGLFESRHCPVCEIDIKDYFKDNAQNHSFYEKNHIATTIKADIYNSSIPYVLSKGYNANQFWNIQSKKKLKVVISSEKKYIWDNFFRYYLKQREHRSFDLILSQISENFYDLLISLKYIKGKFSKVIDSSFILIKSNAKYNFSIILRLNKLWPEYIFSKIIIFYLLHVIEDNFINIPPPSLH